MNRLAATIAMLVMGSGLLAAAGLVSRASAETDVRSSGPEVRDGGTLRVGVVGGIDSIDPAVAPLGTVAEPYCAPLIDYRDKPIPQAFLLRPEAAAAMPDVSRDGKTYTFTIKKGLRFSSGARLTARNFAEALNRLLNPRIATEIAQSFTGVAGAKEVMEGRARSVSGVTARGQKLVVRLTKPDPSFYRRTTILCPVPIGLRVDPEGVGAPLPGSGPYYVASWIRGGGLTMRRNRFYGGDRPHHVERIVWVAFNDFGSLLRAIERGTLDTHEGAVPTSERERLVRKFGVNRSQYFVTPVGGFLFYLALNAERPLFKNNARLRRAVNFAIDRRSLASIAPYTFRVEDRYMPPVFPDVRRRFYPARPNLQKARKLARGRTRGSKAVFYTRTGDTLTAQAQIVKRNLAALGIDVDVKQFPSTVFYEKVATPGEPFDIALGSWIGDYFDPAAYLNPLIDSSQIPAGNWAHFRSAKYDRLLRRAATLQGRERYRAYGSIEYQLRTKAAPWAVYGTTTSATLVSKRVGCRVIRLGLDVTAACLKRSSATTYDIRGAPEA